MGFNLSKEVLVSLLQNGLKKYPQFAAFSGKVRADPEAYSRLAEALDWFSDSVDPTGYVAGTNHITLADIR